MTDLEFRQSLKVGDMKMSKLNGTKIHHGQEWISKENNITYKVITVADSYVMIRHEEYPPFVVSRKLLSEYKKNTSPKTPWTL
jgi:hypothetical protein